jgi:hypothetical protein
MGAIHSRRTIEDVMMRVCYARRHVLS